jgi:hypothetical protein
LVPVRFSVVVIVSEPALTVFWEPTVARFTVTPPVVTSE